jgi:hypothetical protein
MLDDDMEMGQESSTAVVLEISRQILISGGVALISIFAESAKMRRNAHLDKTTLFYESGKCPHISV